jgi:hypothetical protein
MSTEHSVRHEACPWLRFNLIATRIRITRKPHAPDALKLPRVGRRVKHIDTCSVFGRVSVLTDQTVKLRAYNVRHRAHPLARMTQSPERNWELWRSSQTPRLGAHRFTEDSGDAAQCFPLSGEVITITLVHDPITVTHKLLERIRVEEHWTTLSVAESEDFTEREALLPKERFPLMQPTAYVTYSNGIGIPLGRACYTNHVIAVDSGVRAKNLTSPAVKDTQNSEGQWSAHKATPTHPHSHRFYCWILNPSQREHLQPVSFGEIRLTVLHIMPRVANAKGIGSNAQQSLRKPCLTQASENGPDRIMGETVSRLRQISAKITLITAQVAFKPFNGAVFTYSLTKIENTLINLSKTLEQGFTGDSTCSKDTGGRDGNDTHFASLLRDRCRDVHRHVLQIHSGLAEFFHRQQGSVTLQEFWVLKFIERTRATDSKQSVEECVLPWEVRYTSGRFEDTTLRLRSVKIAVQVTRDQRPQVFIVTAFRPRALHNRVLGRRCVFPNTISQLTSKLCIYILLDALTDKWARMYRFRDITSMVQQPMRGTRPTSNRKSPRHSCERKNATGFRASNASKPPLHGPGYLLYVLDFPLRETSVTEGHAQVLKLVAQPVSTSRAAIGYPLADYPATILLRNTRGHETSPYCLPNSSMGVDFTPMGLLLSTFGERRGTYYTATKK